jgi:hypothetical protein
LDGGEFGQKIGDHVLDEARFDAFDGAIAGFDGEPRETTFVGDFVVDERAAIVHDCSFLCLARQHFCQCRHCVFDLP